MIEVALIHGIESLPYRPVFLAWDAHSKACPVCQTEVQRAEEEGVPDLAALCPVGFDANEAVFQAVARQHRLSVQN